MEADIILVFTILGLALLLFFTAWVRMDVVAILVMVALAFTGITTPQETLAGFSNPAVITVWAMFILSAALYQTGIASFIGQKVLVFAGKGETKLIVLIMLSAGLLSGFMNNIGVAALMLPVVMDISRKQSIPPSRLLLPLAYATMLGGLTTMIGTPPNLLISYTLESEGLKPFSIFDFTPIGITALLAGTAFMAFVGRHLLPSLDTISESRKEALSSTPSDYFLEKESFILKIQPASSLVGQTLAKSRLRSGLSLHVLSINRKGKEILNPGPDTIIKSHDELRVQGNKNSLKALQHWDLKDLSTLGHTAGELLERKLNIYEAKLTGHSSLKGKRLQETDFRQRLGINVLAIKRQNRVLHGNLQDQIILADDILLLQGPDERLHILQKEKKLTGIQHVSASSLIEGYNLDRYLFILQVSENADLFEQSVAESQIGSAFGMTAIGIFREDAGPDSYAPGTKLQPGDILLIKALYDDIPLFMGLKELDIIDEPISDTDRLEREGIQMAEAVLSPRSPLAGKTLLEINFRQKYGLSVLAIMREGKAVKTDVQHMPLRLGDALLLYGKTDSLELLGQEEHFIVLTALGKGPRRTDKALTASLIMLGILIPVIAGLIPLAIAALAGIVLMVLTACLRMEEAYRAIEWRAVFLIAGMLPLGTAMQKTGAAGIMADGVIHAFGYFGPWGVIAGLYLLTATLTIAIHPAALVVIMAPVALEAAASFGMAPHTVTMAVAIAAAAVFISPISHAANLLVMGPGGYRFSDYLKVGIPMSLLLMLVAMLLLPHIWPL